MQVSEIRKQFRAKKNRQRNLAQPVVTRMDMELFRKGESQGTAHTMTTWDSIRILRSCKRIGTTVVITNHEVIGPKGRLP